MYNFIYTKLKTKVVCGGARQDGDHLFMGARSWRGQ